MLTGKSFYDEQILSKLLLHACATANARAPGPVTEWGPQPFHSLVRKLSPVAGAPDFHSWYLAVHDEGGWPGLG